MDKLSSTSYKTTEPDPSRIRPSTIVEADKTNG